MACLPPSFCGTWSGCLGSVCTLIFVSVALHDRVSNFSDCGRLNRGRFVLLFAEASHRVHQVRNALTSKVARLDYANSMDEIIDSIIRYTIENGLFTSILTVTSFICVRFVYHLNLYLIDADSVAHHASELHLLGHTFLHQQKFVLLSWTVLHDIESIMQHTQIRSWPRESVISLSSTSYEPHYSLNARSHIRERSQSSADQHNHSFRLPTLLSSAPNTSRNPTVCVSPPLCHHRLTHFIPRTRLASNSQSLIRCVRPQAR